MQKFDAAMIRSFDFDRTYKYWKQLEFNQAGKLNTWFVFWYAQMFLRNGLSLFPIASLVRNIGHDGSGVHCDANNLYDMELSSKPLTVKPIFIEESRQAIEAHKKYFKRISPSIANRIFRRVRRLMSGSWV